MSHVWPSLIPLAFLAPYFPWAALSGAGRSAARLAPGTDPVEADGCLPAGESVPA